MEDQWMHRSDEMKCKSCMWFCPKVAMSPQVVDEKAALEPTPHVIHLGRCRKHAPTMSGYPVVFVNDWCGDHKLNENYIHRIR